MDRRVIRATFSTANLDKVQQNVPKSVNTCGFVPDCPLAQSEGNSPADSVTQWQNLLSADRFTKHRDRDDMWGLLQARCVSVCTRGSTGQREMMLKP